MSYSTFDGNHYLQINGTAMGIGMAPSYANNCIGELEERLLLSSLKQPLSWVRYIDDVDMKWIHSDKDLSLILPPRQGGQHDNRFIL
jgi:hypothetical protein